MSTLLTTARLSENARRVLESRYLLRDAHGQIIESPEQLFDRIARTIGEACGNGDGVDKMDEYRNMLGALDFLPDSATLMDPRAECGQLSADFVVPVVDLLENEKRRGVSLGIVRVDDPDIMEFIQLKSAENSTPNMHLAVGVTDAFMRTLEQQAAFALVHPATHQATQSVPANELFDAMTHAAWTGGISRIVFLDAIKRANPIRHLDDIEAMPYGSKVPLLSGDACHHGFIDLAHMVTSHDDCAEVNWDKLRRTVHLAVRFLDDVIDAAKFSCDEVANTVRGSRKIGLGVMGFADMLIMLGLSYDSDAAVAFGEELMRFIANESLTASEALAVQRGMFPNWHGSLCEAQGLRVRNATRTAIAPTGTIGIIANASGGIEPLFALAYRRSHSLGGEPMSQVNPVFVQHVGPYATSLIDAVSKHGTLREVNDVTEKTRRLFVTALEIPPERHLQMQVAFQRHVDNSVSKTIYVPAEATVADIASLYRRAWALGLKGITVLRYACKPVQVLELGL